jgi:hypothetical protein
MYGSSNIAFNYIIKYSVQLLSHVFLSCLEKQYVNLNIHAVLCEISFVTAVNIGILPSTVETLPPAIF